ncbi:MAG TPA: MFS transporter [Candidatus Limnocylindrales bacterium]|jgi:MFS family permease
MSASEKGQRPPLVTPTFIALFVSALAFFGAGGIVLPVATRFANGPLDASGLGVGVGIGAFSIAALLFRPVVGWASDRFGRRPLLLLGGSVTVAAFAAHLLADSLPAFIVVRSVYGIGEAFFFVACVAAVSDLAPEERRGEAINIASLSVYLGLAVGPVLGEAILAATDFDVVWIVAAAITGVATVLALLVPETAPAVLAAALTGERPPRGRLFHPAGILPGFLILTGAWGMAGFLAFVPLHATSLGLDGAGIPLAMYAAIVVLLRIIFVRLPDEIGAARLSGGALIIGAVGLALVGTLPGTVGLFVGTAVFAAGIAFMFPALIAVAVGLVDEAERGSVVGTSSVFLDLSFGLSPALLGLVVDASGYPAAFMVSAIVSAIGAAVLVHRRRSLVAQPRPA